MKKTILFITTVFSFTSVFAMDCEKYQDYAGLYSACIGCNNHIKGGCEAFNQLKNGIAIYSDKDKVEQSHESLREAFDHMNNKSLASTDESLANSNNSVSLAN
jgi:hypothetical protein